MSESFENINPEEMLFEGDKDWWIRFSNHQQKKIERLRKELEEKSATIRKYMNKSGEYWRQVELLTRCSCNYQNHDASVDTRKCRPCQNKQQIENMESEE